MKKLIPLFLSLLLFVSVLAVSLQTVSLAAEPDAGEDPTSTVTVIPGDPDPDDPKDPDPVNSLPDKSNTEETE